MAKVARENKTLLIACIAFAVTIIMGVLLGGGVSSALGVFCSALFRNQLAAGVVGMVGVERGPGLALRGGLPAQLDGVAVGDRDVGVAAAPDDRAGRLEHMPAALDVEGDHRRPALRVQALFGKVVAVEGNVDQTDVLGQAQQFAQAFGDPGAAAVDADQGRPLLEMRADQVGQLPALRLGVRKMLRSHEKNFQTRFAESS